MNKTVLTIAMLLICSCSYAQEGKVTNAQPDEVILPESNQSAGSYLAARHAQNQRDWGTASNLWKDLLENDNVTLSREIRKKATLTAVGAGDFDLAIKLAKQSLDEGVHTLNPFDQMILASFAVKQDDLPLAKKVLNDIQDESFQKLVVPFITEHIEKNPDETIQKKFSESLAALAQLFFRESRNDSALLFARLAQYLDADLDNLKLLIADILFNSQQYDNAYSVYTNVTPEDENYERAQIMAARTLWHQGQKAKAINTLQALKKSTQSETVIKELADFHRLNENFDAAIANYSTIIGGFEDGVPAENDYSLYYLRGIAYERNGQWGKAEKDLLTALEYFPENPGILNYLGYSWIDRDMQMERGEALIRKALDINPDDGFITDSLGWALYKKGEYEEAVKYLERAVELEPYDPILNDHLGDAYWKVGRKKEARFQWQRALNYKSEQALEIDADLVREKLAQGLGPNGS